MFTRCQPRCIKLARTRGSMSDLWSRIAFKREREPNCRSGGEMPPASASWVTFPG